MLKSLLSLSLIYLFCSCTSTKENNNKDHSKLSKSLSDSIYNVHENEIQLLKDLVFCKCIRNSVSMFSKEDSGELYTLGTRNRMEHFFVEPFRIEHFLDTIIYRDVIKEQIEVKNDTINPVAEGTQGKTFYTKSCLDYYRSKKLDSILRTIPREKYYRPMD